MQLKAPIHQNGNSIHPLGVDVLVNDRLNPDHYLDTSLYQINCIATPPFA